MGEREGQGTAFQDSPALPGKTSLETAVAAFIFWRERLGPTTSFLRRSYVFETQRYGLLAVDIF